MIGELNGLKALVLRENVIFLRYTASPCCTDVAGPLNEALEVVVEIVNHIKKSAL